MTAYGLDMQEFLHLSALCPPTSPPIIVSTGEIFMHRPRMQGNLPLCYLYAYMVCAYTQNQLYLLPVYFQSLTAWTNYTTECSFLVG